MFPIWLQIRYGAGVGVNGMSLQSLREQNFAAVFVGIGLPEAKRDKMFDGTIANVTHSLTRVASIRLRLTLPCEEDHDRRSLLR